VLAEQPDLVGREVHDMQVVRCVVGGSRAHVEIVGPLAAANRSCHTGRRRWGASAAACASDRARSRGRRTSPAPRVVELVEQVDVAPAGAIVQRRLAQLRARPRRRERPHVLEVARREALNLGELVLEVGGETLDDLGAQPSRSLSGPARGGASAGVGNAGGAQRIAKPPAPRSSSLGGIPAREPRTT